jgi:hypothetical protein
MSLSTKQAVAVRLALLGAAVVVGFVSLVVLHSPQILFVLGAIIAAAYSLSLFARGAPASVQVIHLLAVAAIWYGTIGSLHLIAARDWLAALLIGAVMSVLNLYADADTQGRLKTAFRESRIRREERLRRQRMP